MSQGVCWRRWRNRQEHGSESCGPTTIQFLPRPLRSILTHFLPSLGSPSPSAFCPRKRMFTSSSGTVTGPADVTDLSQPGGLGDERGSDALGSVRHLDRWTFFSQFFPGSVVDLVFDIITGFRQRQDSLRSLLLTFQRLIVKLLMR